MDEFVTEIPHEASIRAILRKKPRETCTEAGSGKLASGGKTMEESFKKHGPEPARAVSGLCNLHFLSSNFFFLSTCDAQLNILLRTWNRASGLRNTSRHWSPPEMEYRAVTISHCRLRVRHVRHPSMT